MGHEHLLPQPGHGCPADLSLREPGLLLEAAQEAAKVRGKGCAEGLGPAGLSDIPTERVRASGLPCSSGGQGGGR